MRPARPGTAKARCSRGFELAWGPTQTERLGDTVTDPDLTGIDVDTTRRTQIRGLCCIAGDLERQRLPSRQSHPSTPAALLIPSANAEARAKRGLPESALGELFHP